MRRIAFHVVGVPKPKGSLRSFKHPKTGEIITKHDNPGTKSWSALVSEAAMHHRPAEGPWRGPCAVTLQFHVPRPKGHYGKKGLKPSAPLYPTSKPDLDKLSRCLKDSMTHIIYHDDALVIREVQSKAYAADVPGVLVEVQLFED